MTCLEGLAMKALSVAFVYVEILNLRLGWLRVY